MLPVDGRASVEHHVAFEARYDLSCRANVDQHLTRFEDVAQRLGVGAIDVGGPQPAELRRKVRFAIGGRSPLNALHVGALLLERIGEERRTDRDGAWRAVEQAHAATPLAIIRVRRDRNCWNTVS